MKSEALKALNTLVATCNAGEKSYKAAAAKVNNPQIKTELTRFAQQRADFRNELESCAKTLKGSEVQESTLSGIGTETAGIVACTILQIS